ncbi:MAG: TorF family putative porin [Pseudomonas sp.]|uniref:TorF family putative porin n=1 Tax=Pseudomonas sp. TaxID=306 RepID=UPI003D14C738
MNHALKLCMAGLVMAPWGASQAIELSKDFSLALNAGIYSDYKSRGVSQTQGDPAIQGSATLSHSSGLYAGVWSSSVDLGLGSATRQEIDYYAGWFWQATDDISLDLAYYDYEYPKQSGLNYSETYARLTAYGAYVGGYYSDDLYGNQSSLYSFVGYGMTLPLDIGLDVRYGRVDFKDRLIADANGHSRDSYNEWQVMVKKEVFSLDWSLSYVDSDLSRSECSNYSGFRDTCSASLVAGVSKSF